MQQTGLYIHWPFCVSKCPYCDFNSHVREKIDSSAWQEAYLREIETVAGWFAEKRVVSSIFFGGGTPSLMPAHITGAIIDKIAALFELTPDVEITLEANPSTVGRERFKGFRAAGVNRLSLGVQSFDDASLKFLGRPHSAAEAIEAIKLSQAVFERTSFDLIYSRPQQTVATWQPELEKGIALAGEHLSLYQLTIEEGTPFYTQAARGDFVIPDEDTAADLYEYTNERMAQAGLPSYEISNYAKEGAESRHNLCYWQYGDYAGIGPGAHGRLSLPDGKVATRMHRSPELWMERVAKDGHGLAERKLVSADEQFTESVMMGMRLLTPLPVHLASRFDPDRVAKMVEEGYLTLDNGFRTTAKGRLCLNRVTGYLLA